MDKRKELAKDSTQGHVDEHSYVRWDVNQTFTFYTRRIYFLPFIDREGPGEGSGGVNRILCIPV